MSRYNDDWDSDNDDDLSDFNDNDFTEVDGVGSERAFGRYASRRRGDGRLIADDEDDDYEQLSFAGFLGEDDNDPRTVVDIDKVPPQYKVRATVFPDLTSALEYLRAARMLRFSIAFYRPENDTFGVAVGNTDPNTELANIV